MRTSNDAEGKDVVERDLRGDLDAARADRAHRPASPRRKTGAARILIADDHAVARRGLRALLDATPGVGVAGEATNGREAVEKASALQPDVAIVDLGMPELNGLEATRLILRCSPRTEVLILTVHESEHVVRDVLQAGARGVVLKSDGGQALVAAVQSLLAHRPFFSSRVWDVVLDGFLRSMAGMDRPEEPLRDLTSRERQVLQLMAEGRMSREIAGALGITSKTVETHRYNIMNKLRLRSVHGVVRYAIRHRLIEA